jgi:hypothetical protein
VTLASSRLAVEASSTARTMLADRERLIDVWRHVILQTLDDYESHVRSSGVSIAGSLFADEPELTGDDRVDAAIAGLAEFLARRDGWQVPAWTQDERRRTLDWWFVDDLPALQAYALRESPLSFRKRGVFIGDGGLQRV